MTCLYRHALECIFAHLRIPALASVCAVNWDWNTAVARMRSVEASMDMVHFLPPSESLLSRHVTSFSFDDLQPDDFLLGEHLDVVRNHKYLKHLEYNYCYLDNQSCTLFANVIRLHTSLTCLDLSRSYIQDLGQLATAIQQNHILTEIRLSGNKFGNVGADLFAAVIKCHPSLRNIDLSLCSIDDVRSLADAIRQNHLLIGVDLSGNGFGDSGAVLLSESIKNHPFLTNLDLSLCGINDIGSIALADAIQENITLLTVNLSHNNKLGIAGTNKLITVVQNHPSLTTLSMYGNPIAHASLGIGTKILI